MPLRSNDHSRFNAFVEFIAFRQAFSRGTRSNFYGHLSRVQSAQITPSQRATHCSSVSRSPGRREFLLLRVLRTSGALGPSSIPRRLVPSRCRPFFPLRTLHLIHPLHFRPRRVRAVTRRDIKRIRGEQLEK